MTNKIQSQTEDKKLKNEQRLNEVQKRALSISKDYEESVLKEIERQN